MADDVKPPLQSDAGTGPGRRRALLGLMGGLVTLAGCPGGSDGDGGGGGGDSSSGGSSGGSSGSRGSNNTSGSTSGDTPPPSGMFGGGQGRILFVNGASVFEYDLATRQIKGLGTYRQAEGYDLVGGVTRANDGSFLVSDYKLSGNNSRVYHCDSTGKVLHAYALKDRNVVGVSLSPDGTRFAYVRTWIDSSKFDWMTMRECTIVDLATGGVTEIRLIQPTDPNAPQRNYEDRVRQEMVWAPDGTLYGMTSIGLYRVDVAAGRSVLLHSFQIDTPVHPWVHPDGREVWFTYHDEPESGKRIGKVDIATGAFSKISASSDGLNDHVAPSLSPDRRWLLMQDVIAKYNGLGFTYYYHVGAIRFTDPPINQDGVPTEFKQANGEKFTAFGRMAWF